MERKTNICQTFHLTMATCWEKQDKTGVEREKTRVGF
jgi:hypothetical protein